MARLRNAGTNPMKQMIPSCYHASEIFEPWEVDIRKRRTRNRRPTLASVAKQADKAGIEVARYEVGGIIIVPGKSEITETTANPWDEVLTSGRH
jgi:hypothetical protein